MSISNDTINFRETFSAELFNEIDAKYALDSTKQSLVPLNFISQIITVPFTFIDLGVGLSKLVEYIYSKRRESKEKHIQEDKMKRGNLRIWDTSFRNVILMEGEGDAPTILDICDKRPIFQIQRGYYLVLKNINIHYIGESKGIFSEVSGPSILIDPISSSIIQVKKCQERADEGIFVLRKPIWVGEPKRNPFV